jgi:hypothetical protein
VVFTGGGGGGSRLEPGLVLNVEPILAWGPAGMALDAALQADGWSWALPAACLSAQFEFSLAILPDQDWRILNFPDQGLADGGAPPF